MSAELRSAGRPTGLNRLLLATQNSFRGIANCYRNESAFRQEVWAACVLIPAGLWLGQTGIERLLLWNPEKRLFSHMWDESKNGFAREAFWGVGNGWAAAGTS